MGTQTRQRGKRVGTAVLALAVTAFLAGCSMPGGDGDVGNRAPNAELDADRTNAWAGDEVTFDAQASSDPDGNVTSWVFDFGDGNKTTVTDEDAARVSHIYTDGGEYEVVVTVVDDGDERGNGPKSDTASVHVAIDERAPVEAVVADAEPILGEQSDATARFALPIEVAEGADAIEVELELSSLAPAGTSQVLVRVLQGSDVIEEQAVQLDAGQSETMDMETLVTDDGAQHTLEVVAEDGSANAVGEWRVLYGDNMGA